MQEISSCKALKKVKRRCMLGTPQDGAHNLQINPRKIKNPGLVNRVRGKREQIEIRKTQVLYTLPRVIIYFALCIQDDGKNIRLISLTLSPSTSLFFIFIL